MFLMLMFLMLMFHNFLVVFKLMVYLYVDDMIYLYVDDIPVC